MTESNESQLLQSELSEIRQSESTYLKELTELVTCCQYNASLVSSSLQVDIAINNNLKNITSSLLSSHLFLRQRILALDDADPLLLINFMNWLSEVAPLYNQYINHYKYDPDQPEREIYLKRRPLVRIRYISKYLAKLDELDVDSGIKRSIEEFLERFRKELANAREKDDQERQKAAVTSISFDNVKCLETMEMTASNFKPVDILMRGRFHMSLKHFQRIANLDIDVELFALADMGSHTNTEETSLIDSVDSLAICSTDKTGSSLLFPPFRFEELRMASLEDEFNFSITAGNIVLVPYYADLENPNIVINLKAEKLSKFDLWLQVFNKLFQKNSHMQRNGEFTTKHKKLATMRKERAGLDIRLPASPVPKYEARTVKASALHKSKQLRSSLPSPELLRANSGESESVNLKTTNIVPVEDHKTLAPTSEHKTSNPGLGTASITNEKLRTHAYKSALFPHSVHNASGASTVKAKSDVKGSEAFRANFDNSEVVPSIRCDKPAITMKQALLRSPGYSEFKRIAESQTLMASEPIPAGSPIKEESASSSHDLKPDLGISKDIETSISVKSSPPLKQETLKPSGNMLALHKVVTEAQPIVEDTATKGATEVNSSKKEKRQRRKSIFSVFGLKKKAIPKVEEKAEHAATLHDNGSSNTLTTEETLCGSKSNRNINKLTIDTSFLNNPKIHQSAEFNDSPSARKLQTAVTTPGSGLPSPFAIPNVESPTVELSEDMKAKFKNSRSLCSFNGRVSTWNENKWEIIGGKEIAISVVVNEEGGYLIGSEEADSDKPLLVLQITPSTSVRRSTALDIQLKTRSEAPQSKVVSTLIRCSLGAHSETLIKALEISKQDLNRPALSTKDSATSLSSSMFSSSISSQSILSKNAYNSMTSITNNNNLADDILSLGRPKVGNSTASLSPSSKTLTFPSDLYFTPPSSAVDLNFSLNGSSPQGSQQLLLLLLSMKIRVHEKENTKWEPKSVHGLELYALESVPNLFHLNISGISVDCLVKSDNVLRVGKAGVLLSLPQDSGEDSLEYMLEFKNKKLADQFYSIVGENQKV